VHFSGSLDELWEEPLLPGVCGETDDACPALDCGVSRQAARQHGVGVTAIGAFNEGVSHFRGEGQVSVVRVRRVPSVWPQCERVLWRLYDVDFVSRRCDVVPVKHQRGRRELAPAGRVGLAAKHGKTLFVDIVREQQEYVPVLEARVGGGHQQPFTAILVRPREVELGNRLRFAGNAGARNHRQRIPLGGDIDMDQRLVGELEERLCIAMRMAPVLVSRHEVIHGIDLGVDHHELLVRTRDGRSDAQLPQMRPHRLVVVPLDLGKESQHVAHAQRAQQRVAVRLAFGGRSKPAEHTERQCHVSLRGALIR